MTPAMPPAHDPANTDIALPPAPGAGSLVVGFSGGLDSTVLLHRLARAVAPVAVAAGAAPARGLRALHVHHGLHADADAWAAHCQATCAALGVALDVVRVRVDTDSGLGLEGAARAARHTAFAAALGAGDILTLAHHRDDQAETFLLRALRASGVDGLAAMRPLRAYPPGWLWRPLLALPRSTLLAYAQARDLQWIEDPGNVRDDLDRNFLRHQVLPLLRQRWPQADAAFARAAALQAETAALLAHDDVRLLADACDGDPHRLEVAFLGRLPAARSARLLRLWIATLGLPPLPAQGLRRIASDLLVDAPGDDARFAWRHACIRRWRGWLHADVLRPSLPVEFRVAWTPSVPLTLPTGDTLSLTSARPLPPGTGFIVHARQGGERITLAGRHHSHALKHVLQDAGIAPWTREGLPLLSSPDGTLLAAGDQVLSGTFAAWLLRHEARLSWQRTTRADAAPPTR
jgi:tRNA(Ile)-lysidine synthase